MSTTEDQYPIQTFPPNGPDETLREGDGSRRSDRRADDPNALGAEDSVEGGCELGIAIPD